MTFFVWMASTSGVASVGSKKKLENVVEALPGDFQLGLSPLVLERDWSALSDLHAQSRDRGVEGFMLKRKNSNYKSGRVKGDWYKWKVDPLHADMVVVSAQLGRASVPNCTATILLRFGRTAKNSWSWPKPIPA